MDPGVPVPPKGYGGHERLVYMFADAYVKMGHEVTLLVGEGSVFSQGKVITFGPEGYPKKKTEGIRDIINGWKKIFTLRKQFDLIHNFGRLAYLVPVLHLPVKKIMTYGREIGIRNIKMITALRNKNLVFTGCSNNLIQRANPPGKWITVYNAINFDHYKINETIKPNAPLMFLGRIEKVKGCHIAIEVAKKTNSRLIIAGNISNLPEERKYYNEQIAPHIDGVQIIYAGEADDVKKNFYLGQAKALLFPIDWNEPFGMVMVEAMACGTPVVAFNKGSVNEVVDEGITGFKVNTDGEMADAIQNKLFSVDRKKCRFVAEQRFNVPVIARQYLSLFE